MSDDYINMHKRIAMGQPGAEKHLKKGGKVSHYAAGGKVMPEAGVANLPARGDKKNGGIDYTLPKSMTDKYKDLYFVSIYKSVLEKAHVVKEREKR